MMSVSRIAAVIATLSTDGLKLVGKAELPQPEPREHHERKPPAPPAK